MIMNFMGYGFVGFLLIFLLSNYIFILLEGVIMNGFLLMVVLMNVIDNIIFGFVLLNNWNFFINLGSLYGIFVVRWGLLIFIKESVLFLLLEINV